MVTFIVPLILLYLSPCLPIIFFFFKSFVPSGSNGIDARPAFWKLRNQPLMNKTEEGRRRERSIGSNSDAEKKESIRENYIFLSLEGNECPSKSKFVQIFILPNNYLFHFTIIISFETIEKNLEQNFDLDKNTNSQKWKFDYEEGGG